MQDYKLIILEMFDEVISLCFSFGEYDGAAVRIELLNHLNHCLMTSIIFHHQSKMLDGL